MHYQTSINFKLAVHVDSNHCWAYCVLQSVTGKTITPKPVGAAAKRSFSNILSIYSAHSKKKPGVVGTVTLGQGSSSRKEPANSNSTLKSADQVSLNKGAPVYIKRRSEEDESIKESKKLKINT